MYVIAHIYIYTYIYIYICIYIYIYFSVIFIMYEVLCQTSISYKELLSSAPCVSQLEWARFRFVFGV